MTVSSVVSPYSLAVSVVGLLVKVAKSLSGVLRRFISKRHVVL
jgi:hypothetical protein